MIFGTPGFMQGTTKLGLHLKVKVIWQIAIMIELGLMSQIFMLILDTPHIAQMGTYFSRIPWFSNSSHLSFSVLNGNAVTGMYMWA